jgi:hypothetical protein
MGQSESALFCEDRAEADGRGCVCMLDFDVGNENGVTIINAIALLVYTSCRCRSRSDVPKRCIQVLPLMCPS